MNTSNSKAKIFGFVRRKGGGAATVLTLTAATLVFTCCPNAAKAPEPATPTVSYGFTAIKTSAKGIAGVEPTYELPGTENYWKGVFTKDRKVKLSPYSLGKTEVPYNLWKEVYGWAVKNGYKFANEGKKGSSGNGSEDEPVTTVSWRDCIVWCNAYTHKTKGEAECIYRKSRTDTIVLKDANDEACNGVYADMSKKGYRLPTEAEWEYAARWQSDSANAEQYGNVWLTKLDSVSGAKGNWKNENEVKEVAWYSANSENKTHPIGKKAENALGLNDMSGNVSEWCFDWYDSNPKKNDAAYMVNGFVTDPQGGSSHVYRVSRGGSCYGSAQGCVVGNRSFYSSDECFDSTGFRVACRP